MHDVLELINIRTGALVHTLRVYQPVSSITRMDEVTFHVGQHDGTVRVCKFSGHYLDECFA